MRDGSTKYFDFAVIGSGVAGLRYALEVAKHGTVAVITKAEPHESNTNYAQGGVSAVLCPSDSVESHVLDTIVAGAYLCDEETVRVSCPIKSFFHSSLAKIFVWEQTMTFPMEYAILPELIQPKKRKKKNSNDVKGRKLLNCDKISFSPNCESPKK